MHTVLDLFKCVFYAKKTFISNDYGANYRYEILNFL